MVATFTNTLDAYPNMVGKFKKTSGTYTSAGTAEGGDIDTGLTECLYIILTPVAAAVVATTPVVNETLPVAGSAVTIVTSADEVGNWEAYGY